MQDLFESKDEECRYEAKLWSASLSSTSSNPGSPRTSTFQDMPSPRKAVPISETVSFLPPQKDQKKVVFYHQELLQTAELSWTTLAEVPTCLWYVPILAL